MTNSQKPLARRTTAVLFVAALSVVGCSGSDGDEDLFDDGDPSTPVDVGSVVPPNGQGGGEPVDNVDEDYNEGGIGNPQSDPDNNQPSEQDG